MWSSLFTISYIEFTSHTSFFLCHKKSINSCYDFMKSMFSTPPVVEFTCKRYIRKKNGKKEKTYTGSSEMSYYSSRDVSGLFKLDDDKATILKKKYIKIHLKKEINFADEITYLIYSRKKLIFSEKNYKLGEDIKIDENRYIPKFKEFTMVTIDDEDSCNVNIGWIILLTFLTLVEFYKIYVESLCIHQEFTIRKLISIFDLNSPKSQEIAIYYEKLVPKINLIVKEYSFSTNDYCYINKKYEVTLITEVEEKQAVLLYKNKIPKYDPSNDGRVINDVPEYEENVENYSPEQLEIQKTCEDSNSTKNPL